VKVLFVAGFGPIVSDMQANQAFYQEVLGLPLEGDESYLSTQHIDGVIPTCGLWYNSEKRKP